MQIRPKLAGLTVAVAGAAGWAALLVTMEREMDLLTVLVGALVGLAAMKLGARTNGYAAICALLTIAGLLGGKAVGAHLRPYQGGFRKQVLGTLAELGFVPGDVCPEKCSNDDAVAFLENLRKLPELLLLPFHEHTSKNGDAVDGIGVALRLPANWIKARIPIAMPVDEFAFASSFPRRLAELKESRPEVAALLLPMPPNALDAELLRNRISHLSKVGVFL
ncbi:MAG: hypothetical protein GY822_09390 [Deltaproteobacteria bacterium]|nr:hypothetical protein [Deltaproteobacteria bacterium]